MKKRLAIFDPEESYTINLIEYLINKTGNLFEIIGFTDIHELLHYAASAEIDILLISQQEVSKVMEQPNIKQIIGLESREEREVCSYPLVYKYQSADIIIREVLEYCPVKEEDYKKAVKSNNTEIIGIYSPVNACGKTSFAMVMAHIYSKGFQTLYINAEEFSGLSYLLSKKFSYDLSDLFYFYKQSPYKLSTKIFSVVQSLYGIDYIPPMSYSTDLRNIDPKEWQGLLSGIMEYSGYEIIILDLSSMVKDVFPLLKECTSIYMPIKRDAVSLSKVREFEEYITYTDNESLLKKITKIEIPEKYLIHEEDNYLEQMLLSPFTNYVRTIIKESFGRE